MRTLTRMVPLLCWPVLIGAASTQPASMPAPAVPAPSEPAPSDAATSAPAMSGFAVSAPAVPAPDALAADKPTAALLAAMSLEQKVGQLFLISVVGRDVPRPSSAEVLRQVPVGGIILFSYNLRGGPAKVAALDASLQEIARTTGAGVPYLIAVDQEGGRVQRLQRGFTRLPAPRILGALPNDQLDALAHAVARQLLAVGVNMNLAPVVEASAGETDVIGDRGFATSATAAAPKAAAFIAGTQRAGVLATAKHFPGNAGSEVDPHRAMPTLSLDNDAIEAQLLPPFRAAIAAGVDAIMVSHVEISALDADRPVALSPVVVQGLLRGQLGFTGLVCSDDLLMGAVVEKFDPAEAAILAVLAGTDLLMVSNPNVVPALHAAVVNAVRDGRIPEDQVDAAVQRQLLMKQRRGLWESADRLRQGDSLGDLRKARREAERILK
ncbi:MAG: glycoside hydrolase family 3 N-terminal domain-containing protein [Pseudomonadota bacterium]